MDSVEGAGASVVFSNDCLAIATLLVDRACID